MADKHVRPDDELQALDPARDGGDQAGEAGGKKKKEKKRRGLFGRKKVPDYDDADDMYYGIQLKPIDEYRKGYDPATGEFSRVDETYQALFDDSKKAIDDEVEENFQRLQRERRRRVAEAVQTAGVDAQEIADEYGVVAPMPVTAFAADPYARQHGIDVEGDAGDQEPVSDLQKAMLESSGGRMEVKLNVLNDTMEIQRVKEVPAVSEESINKIVESVAEEMRQQNAAKAAAAQAAEPPAPTAEVPPEQPAPVQEIPAVPEAAPAPENDADGTREAEAESTANPETNEPAPAEPAPETVIGGRALGEIPQIASIYEYRSRSIPTHVINADVLQSALLSESESLSGAEGGGKPQPARRRARTRGREEPELQDTGIGPGESIEDYTGEEDARSISHELSSDMRELTMRMTVTGVCTALLALVNVIFGGRFAAGAEGVTPVVYVVLTMLFLAVAAGICRRTVLGGLKALFSLSANADSAVAVAAVAVAVQTVCAVFFRSELTDGRLHLYAVVLTALLFVNAAGKLTMIRRIHSNFRFVSSREQKYDVRLYDDYNNALKMAGDKLTDRPVIAYQGKAGFLKRFLELSYRPDPSEAAAQTLAPIGLIASLVVSIVCLLITRSLPTALSALAAACCACVAAGNMLSVNLPISRLCRTARRAGGMVVGYEAVERFGQVNAVLVDAAELFPQGTVVLGGIKTFGSRAVAEEAIIAASALMNEVGGPLSGVFDQVISENEEELPEVQEWAQEGSNGIVGWVDGREICIGSRALLEARQIDGPSREEESQYASGSQNVIYLALDGVTAAMLVLSYSGDRRKRNELQRLEQSGITVLVRSSDPNVTPALLSRVFSIDGNSVSVLEGEVSDEAERALSTRVPRADAVVATKGRMESLMSLVSACVQERRTAGLVVAIQNAAVVLGFVLVAFMACFGGMRQLSAFVLFAFELFWLLVIIVLPKLRR